MKILQLIDTLNPGGAERMCVNIANTLHNNGIEVIICTSREGGSLQKEISKGILYYCLRKKSFFDIRAYCRLLKIIKSHKINIIHAHSTSLFWAVLIKMFYRNVKIIWHDHLGLKVEERGNILLYKILSYKVDGIISVNSDLESWSKKNMKVPGDKVILINNFPQIARKEKSKCNGTFIIVCLANIRPQKDHETLIKALSLILKTEPGMQVKLILAGTYWQDSYFLKLKDLIFEKDLGSNIEFAGPIEDIATLLSRADCGVLSSASEGLPVSLLEYGMAALPVVVTAVGQCAEVVGYGSFGRVVNPRDPEAMANAIISVMNDKGAISTGLAFMEHIKRNYGPDGFMKNYTVLLNKVLNHA